MVDQMFGMPHQHRCDGCSCDEGVASGVSMMRRRGSKQRLTRVHHRLFPFVSPPLTRPIPRLAANAGDTSMLIRGLHRRSYCLWILALARQRMWNHPSHPLLDGPILSHLFATAGLEPFGTNQRLLWRLLGAMSLCAVQDLMDCRAVEAIPRFRQP